VALVVTSQAAPAAGPPAPTPVVSKVALDSRPPRACELPSPDGLVRNGCPRLIEEPFQWTGQVVDAQRGLIYETQQSQLVILDSSLNALGKVKGFHTLRAPVLLGGVVYGFDRDAVVAIDVDQRRMLWRVSVPSSAAWQMNSLGAADGSLWMRWRDTRLLQFNPATRRFSEHPEVGRPISDITSDPTSENGLLIGSYGVVDAQLHVSDGKVSVAREFGGDGYGEALQLRCDGLTALSRETDQANITTWYLTDQQTRHVRSVAGVYTNMRYPTECSRPLVFGWNGCYDYCRIDVLLEGRPAPLGRIVLPYDKEIVSVDLVPDKDLLVVVEGDGYDRNFVATYALSSLVLNGLTSGPMDQKRA
jgi:hypothetical protein